MASFTPIDSEDIDAVNSAKNSEVSSDGDSFDPSQLLFPEGDVEERPNEATVNSNKSLRPGGLTIRSIFKGGTYEPGYSPVAHGEVDYSAKEDRPLSPDKNLAIDEEETISLDSGSGLGSPILQPSSSTRKAKQEPGFSTNVQSTTPLFKNSSEDSHSDTYSIEDDYISPNLQEDGSIYLEQLSSKKGSKGATANSLEEGLLPTRKKTPRSILGATSFLGQRQKFKDVAFLLLYIFSALLFLIVNTVVLFKASQSSLIAQYASGTIYRAIRESLGAVIVAIIVSLIVGLFWLISVCLLTKPLMWFTFLSMPAISFSVFIAMLTKGFLGFSYESGESSPSTQSKVLSLIPLAATIIHAFLIKRYHNSIAQAIEIIRMASVVLKNNIDIFSVSLLCLASHVLFSATWLISFDRLFLLGHVDTIRGDKLWITDDTLYLLVPFYVGFFLWTSSIINNIERCTIGGAVSQWYFHQHSNHTNGFNATHVALRRALTTSFGSLSFAGLLMSAVKVLKSAKSIYQKQLGSGILSAVTRIMLTPLVFLANLVEGISAFTVSYVGISGKPFLHSSKVASSILSKTFFRTLIANYVIRVTIYSAIATASTLTGYVFFALSADSIKTDHTFTVGTIGLAIPYFILKFLMNILLYTTDAVYLCYGIDLDQKTVHNPMAHNALSSAR